MKLPSTGSNLNKISAVYLIDDAAGTVHVRSKTMRLLVPIFPEKGLEEAYLINEAKRVIAADHDVGEEHICVVGVGQI